MRLCNAGLPQLLYDISNKTNLSLEEGNNNDVRGCVDCNIDNNKTERDLYSATARNIKTAIIREDLQPASKENETLDQIHFVSDLNQDAVIPHDDNGNNYDCGDNLESDKHFHKHFYETPKVIELSPNILEQPFPASFTVHTSILPVSGVFETTVLPEDDSPSEEMDLATDVQACSKLAKDTANELKVEKKGEESGSSDPWLPLGKSPRHLQTTVDNAAFDVYNIETALPRFDLDAIESNLKVAKRDECRRRNDREEIRRRLAMDADDTSGNGCRKPSLQARLQGGMNLQICFMNDISNDSDTESSSPPSPPTVVNQLVRPNSLPIKNVLVSPPLLGPPGCLGSEANLAACQARLQAEARHALMQAHEMARMQMHVERQMLPISPITQMIRNSLVKVGVSFTEDRRRLSRQLVTEMNVAQLQIITNDLHSQIELLNDELVQLLVSRDDLHMEQDSMLVDIEDLTRFIDAKCVQDGDTCRDVPA